MMHRNMHLSSSINKLFRGQNIAHKVKDSNTVAFWCHAGKVTLKDARYFAQRHNQQ